MKTAPCVSSGQCDAAPTSRESGLHFPRPGAVVDGKYRVGRLLGRGGTSAVFKATHLSRRTPVALKIIDLEQVAQPEGAERFIRESVAASRLNCEHIARVFDVGHLPSGAPYLAVELLEAGDLERRLAAAPGGRLGAAQAVHYVLQILRALQVAHAAGVVHGDLKLASVFLADDDGEDETIKLLDFGVGRLADAREVTPRDDLYAVGAMLYELLSGKAPDAGRTADGRPGEPSRLCERRDLPAALAAVVHRALSPSPDARPASAADFARLLAPFAGEPSARVLAQLVPDAPPSLSPTSLNGVATSTRPPAPEPTPVLRRRVCRTRTRRMRFTWVRERWERLVERWPLLIVAMAVGLASIAFFLAPGQGPSLPAVGGVSTGAAITTTVDPACPAPPVAPAASAPAASSAAGVAQSSAPSVSAVCPKPGS
jgi:protein kinase-like protein